MSNVIKIHRRLCDHDRWPDECVRCDPWCPAGATDEQKDMWQGWVDQIRAAAKDNPDGVVGLPGGLRVRVVTDGT